MYTQPTHLFSVPLSTSNLIDEQDPKPNVPPKLTAVYEGARSEAIRVARPLVPELDDLVPMLQDIFDRRWLTNNGPYLKKLEAALTTELGVLDLAVVTNGTCALEMCLRALHLEPGEVITTGFSFPATWHCILDQPGLTPRFADIGPDYGLSPEAVAAAITPQSRAILAVHTYGYPAEVEALQRIADDHRLPLIYDAAHAFGVEVNGRSIAQWGTLSAFSFHATKGFNTLEGGCVAGPEQSGDSLKRLRLDRNFGIINPDEIVSVGRNGKMDEVRAAIGLLVLKKVPELLERRAAVVRRYLDWFSERSDPTVEVRAHQYARSDRKLNFGYFPVRVRPKGRRTRDSVVAAMEKNGVFARKYFYPSVTTAPLYEDLFEPGSLPETASASQEVLCLPLHHELSAEDLDRVLAAFGDAL